MPRKPTDQLALFSPGGNSRITAGSATFSDAKDEPFHSWYPYLEGYSSGFVRAVHEQYMPGAASILEPFAGTGTTPISLSERGIVCSYTEANPAMRFIVNTKLQSMGLRGRERAAVVRTVADLAGTLRRRTARIRITSDLQKNHSAAFGKSTYFTPSNLEEVLKLRNLNDRITTEHALSGHILTVAVLAELVNASLLKRAGDVRFRTPKELALGVPSLIDLVSNRLWSMARDLTNTECQPSHATDIGNDARQLKTLASLSVDGVITSPPYLNGTNYIRNTRLELWYLRALKSPQEQRVLRDTVVTSGINDVSSVTPDRTGIDEIDDVLATLRSAAYDDRLVQMAAGYFVGMDEVFTGLRHHMRSGGIACIDIGDSRYAGVTIPTGSLLVTIASHRGFALAERRFIRRRQSRDGTPLTQELLVLAAVRPDPRRGPGKPLGALPTSWTAFKEGLPHLRTPYNKRNWGSALHSLCSYAGKMKPSIARHLVEAFSEPGDLVVDPFAGSGTIPLEACLTGRLGIGLDISELGYCLTRAKVEPPTSAELQTALSEFEQGVHKVRVGVQEMRAAASVSFNKSLSEYYHEDTLKEIIAARKYFLSLGELSTGTNFLRACLLHILHGNRPYALSRRSHPITPYAPSGPKTYRGLTARLVAKAERAMASATELEGCRGRSVRADATEHWPIEDASVGAVITSPPFTNSTKFYLANWIRLWFTGWDLPDFESKPAAFVERRQIADFEVYDGVLRNVARVLRPGAFAIFHLGLSERRDMAEELSPIARRHLIVRDVFVESVAHCESHGIRDKGGTSHHQYLVLQKQ